MEIAASAVWEGEPVRGFYFDPRLFALSGLEQLQSFDRHLWLPPPVHYLCGLTFVTAGENGSVFTLPATGWLLPPEGVVSGATLALLADGPLGSAVQTALPPATPYTTSEISLTFLRTVGADGRNLRGVAKLVHAGRSVLLADADIMDAAGNLVATASTRCVALPKMELPPELLAHPPDLPALEEPEWPSPHPFERAVEGTVQPQELFDRISGLELMQGCSNGDLEAPPVSRLLGLWPVEVEEGRTRWTMPASEWMCSPVQGRLYGGITAFFAGNAIDGAFLTVTPPGAAMAPLDLKVYFLRPITPDGRPLSAVAEVAHRGRTTLVGRSEVFDADGKLVALAISSAMILRGRPATITRLPVPEDLPAPEGDD